MTGVAGGSGRWFLPARRRAAIPGVGGTDRRAALSFRRPGNGRAWLVTVVTAALAAAGGVALAGVHYRHPGGQWWPLLGVVLVPMMAFEVHLTLRRQTHVVDLSGLPLVVGAVLLSPAHVLMAAAAGMAGSKLLRREPLIRALFNVANLMLGAEALIWCVNYLGGPTPLSLRGVAAMALGLVASEAVTPLGVLAVMTASTGWPGLSHLPTLAVQSLVVTVAEVVLATVAVAAYTGAPWALALLALPTLVIGRWYSASERLRLRFADLQSLYAYSGALASVVERSDVLEVALRETCRILGCDQAWLYLPDGGGFVRYRLASGGVIAEPAEAGGPEGRVITSMTPVLLAAATRTPYLDERGLKDLMAVPLTLWGRRPAALVVADRHGSEGRSFSSQDLDFLQALGGHLSTALTSTEHLENLRLSAAELEYQATHDSLTGMANRALFMNEVARSLRESTGSRMVAVVLMDIDALHEVNDALGHQTGDDLLKIIGERIEAVAGGVGTVARLGGDEFVFLVPSASSVEEVAALAELVMDAVAVPMEIGTVKLNVRAAAGIALAPVHGLDAPGLLRSADVAMYAAKRSGRHLAVYEPSMDQSSVRRLALATALAEAIERDELMLWYQPVADIATGTVTGFEALLRWPHPELGFIGPDEFIPIAEQTGLIEPLTWWVMREALGELRQWREDGYEFSMAVNVSVRSLDDASVVERLRRLLADFGLSPSSLTLEVTESSMMIDLDRSSAVLRRISDLGIRVAIDDFGTGYSSLSRLKVLPVNVVKIDRAFVKSICSDRSDQALVKAIIDVAGVMGHKVVAEGIEDLATWNRLATMGCDLAQGYYFARAMPAADCRAWVVHRQPPSLAVVRSLRRV